MLVLQSNVFVGLWYVVPLVGGSDNVVEDYTPADVANNMNHKDKY